MKIQKYTPLLNIQEISEIFNDGDLLEKESFYIIDKKTKEYNTLKKFQTYIETANEVRNSFISGHTIIVKNLENYNENIRLACASLGRDVDVHMYLVPENGKDSFDFHKDDREVYVHMIYGEKEFILKKDGLNISHYLSKGDTLNIPFETVHKAIPKGKSCLLSFGINPKEYYKIYGGIKVSDL
jgi:ribosomal protein L16 Arg81 hydroxylase